MRRLFVLTTTVFIIEHVLLIMTVLQIGFRVLHSPIHWVDLLVFGGLILCTMFTVGVLTFITVRGASE